MAEAFAERMKYLLGEIKEEGIKEIIEKAERTLDEIQSTLGDDKMRKVEDKEAVVLWAKELEDSTYELEDALYKWRVNSIELKARSDRLISRGKLALFAQCCIPLYRVISASMKTWKGMEGLASDMENRVETLFLKGKKLFERAKKLKVKDGNESGENDQGLMVSSVREGDKDLMLEHLFSPKNGGKVISIAGFGGSGKTTLARSLYNHPSVAEHFQVRGWVHVEADISDGKEIASKLLESLRIPYSKESAELEPLLQLLQDSISRKTVLVVFDGVRSEEAAFKLLEPFNKLVFENSEVTSRILVTTRNERAGGDIVHTLAPLSVADCKLILMSVAGYDAGKDGESIHGRAAEICEGSPLVARILGMKLRSKDTTEEELINNVFMVEVCMVRFPQLYQTYHNLLPHLKPCLLSYANFPKGTVIDSVKLIQLWMSQGYLGYPPSVLLSNSSNKNTDFSPYREVEKKGVEYLSKLIDQSFFEGTASQSIHKPLSDLNQIYKMPDNAHDFITYMAQAQAQAHRKCRFFISPKVPVSPDLFGQWKRMTALVLSSCQLDELPDDVSLLTRLQYLDLSDNPLKILPSTICKLYYLEFLDVHFCYLLSRLPKQVGDLRQMRHLRIKHTTEELHDFPFNFQNMTLMRTLDVFRVGGKYSYATWMLEFLNHLIDLCIAVHGVVRHLSWAQLESKDHMVNLELSFVGEGRKQEVASSIEDMIPPPSLQMLKFDHYPGRTLPKWILSESVIERLKRLSLRSAANISSLPALWKLSRLEFLWLYDIPNLKHLGCEFFGFPSTQQQKLSPKYQQTRSECMSEDDDDDDEEEEEINDHTEAGGEITVEESGDRPDAEREEAVAFRSLKTLRIEYLENWETWEDANEADESNNIKVMPCLEEFIIAHCPKLKGKPLHILKDTPWFKNSYRKEVENTGEAHEKNVKQPSKGANAALKASYIKLKKFVRDAYMTRTPAQPLKVSIPEGVLGKTRETTYLQLDYLHDWFEKDRSIFAEQMCVWSKHVYELMKTSDKERVQIVSSGLIKKVGRQEHSDERAEDLVDFMMENKAKIYLVPFLSPGHWELLAIIPESDVVYWFDSLQGSISPELTEFLNMVERKYVTGNLNSTLAHDISWKVVDIKHKRQVDNWQCGYYVMIWMQKIALEIPDLNLEAHFPTDESPYEPDKLREVDLKWCAQVMLEIAA